MDNSLVVTGTICRQVDHSESPAGIPHSYLVIEHQSVQQEAGFNRQVYVRSQFETGKQSSGDRFFKPASEPQRSV